MKIYIILLIIPLILFIGCDPEGSQISITKIGWLIENINPLFWTVWDTDATCFINFWINYEGDNIFYSDIDYVKITASDGTYWSMDEDDFYAEYKYFGGYLRNYDDERKHYLPMGIYNAEIALVNGHVTTKELTVPVPGSTSTDGKTFVYTESFIGSPS